MTFLEITLSVLCLTMLVALVWCGRTLYRLGTTVLRIQDELETSLDIIDERVDSMDKILEIPLFSDSPEIKRLRSDMTTCRESILDIAYALSNSIQTKNENPGTELE